MYINRNSNEQILNYLTLSWYYKDDIVDGNRLRRLGIGDMIQVTIHNSIKYNNHRTHYSNSLKVRVQLYAPTENNSQFVWNV